MKFGALSLAAEAKILELNHGHHRIVVIGLDEVDVVRLDAGRTIEVVAVENPAAASLDRVFGKRVMAFDRSRTRRDTQARASAVAAA